MSSNITTIFTNTTHPKFYWDFRTDSPTTDANGTYVTDIMNVNSQNLKAIATNNASFDSQGALFDTIPTSMGSLEYVAIDPFTFGGQHSIEIYFNRATLPNGNESTTWQGLVTFTNGTGTTDTYRITSGRGAANTLGFANFDNNVYPEGGLITSNVWNHLVMTVDTNGVWKAYLNNTLDTTFSMTHVPSTVERQINWIGAVKYSNVYEEHFYGRVGYVRIWQDHTLTTSEISNLYNTRETAYSTSSGASYENVPTITVEENSDTVSSTSISTQDLTDSAVVGTTLAEKRNFTKNAVIDMFDANPSVVSGKKLVLKAGAVLPGFSAALVEDTILVDGRTSATLAKTDIINRSFYIPMEVNSVVTLASFNDTVTITQNAQDFTIVTSVSTSTKVAGDTFTYDNLTILLGSVYGSLSSPVICFKEGTKITCLHEETQEEVERPIETIHTDTYVKTYKHGFIKVKKVSCRTLYNPKHTEILKNRLYVCENFSGHEGLYEPLVMTGCHAILTDTITNKQKQLMEEQLGTIFVTDDKYRLLSMYDDRVKPYCEEGEHKIWHVCLDHHDPGMNYGIYANGLLVESCCEINIERYG